MYIDFLNNIDDFIYQNMNMSCDDLHNLYFSFWGILKEFKGGSAGFTGLSEYLIFRFMYIFLGKEFKIKALTKDMNEYEREDGLKLYSNVNIKVDNKIVCPDIVIESKNIMRVLSIKIYLSNGRKTLEDEFYKLKLLKDSKIDFRALVIIYVDGSSSIKNFITNYISQNTWLDCIFLENNKVHFNLFIENLLTT